MATSNSSHSARCCLEYTRSQRPYSSSAPPPTSSGAARTHERMLELYVMRTHIIRSTQRGKHLANMPCKISRFSLRNPLVSLLYTMSAGHDANRSPLSKAMGATASAIHSCSTATSSRQGLHHSGGERHLVYFDHDAGSDDFVAFVYFLQHRQR